MHKRRADKLQERRIQRIILNGSLYDRKMGEMISTMTRIDVMGQLHEEVEVHRIPDIEKGEVLLDNRGRGSLQRQ